MFSVLLCFMFCCCVYKFKCIYHIPFLSFVTFLLTLDDHTKKINQNKELYADRTFVQKIPYYILYTIYIMNIYLQQRK